MEPHSKKGFHYHMCIKFDRNQRWVSSKQYLSDTYNIVVNFQDNHAGNYISAYRYVIKCDPNMLHSVNHPDLDLTKSAITSKTNKTQ